MYSPKDIVDSGLCIGCGICTAQSGTHEQSIKMKFDIFGNLKPNGPAEWYSVPSESFSKLCPFSPEAKNEDYLSEKIFPSVQKMHTSIGRYITNYAGHVFENDFRMSGSSGGLTSWVACELMRQGLIDGVAHVIATENPDKEKRFFKYRISRNEKEILEGAKSRYYPVELSEILKLIKEVPGKYAVVAIPCMIKAIQLLRMQDEVYRDRILFTLGLFCGHMKSARFVESFAWQMNVPVAKIKYVDFRYKYPDRPANWYNVMIKLHDGTELNRDWWHLADGDWGSGFLMNSACNFCDDVVAETADISFGDAWIEPYITDGKGTNVVIIRSPLINNLINAGIKEGRLKLEEVSAQLIEQTQAAGLRQRREGLAYRLTWVKLNIKPLKRVLPDRKISKSRKMIYRMRYRISKFSHLVFRLARNVRLPILYVFWARIVTSVYYGRVYKNGNVLEIIKRFRELKH